MVIKNKYTLLLIPPDHAPTRQYHLPVKSKHIIGISFLLVSGLIGGLAIHDYLQTRYIKENQEKYAYIDQLQSQLEEKDQEINHLNEQNSKIAQNLDSIQTLEGKISSILKLNPPAASSNTNNSVDAQTSSFNPTNNVDNNTDLSQIHLALFQQFYDESVKYEDKQNHTPSILPVIGDITSFFGYRKNPFGGWSSEFHNGIDIACNYGTPVKVTADGVVVYAGWDNVYGRKVEIDHGDGIITFYGHNSKLLVKKGDQVKKGQIICDSGNSGRSTGAHLHYGAIVDGKNVDPLMFTNSVKEQ